MALGERKKALSYDKGISFSPVSGPVSQTIAILHLVDKKNTPTPALIAP
jgi:hypothetical protein